MLGTRVVRATTDIGSHESAARLFAVLSDPRRQVIPLAGANGRLVVSSTRRAALVLSGLEPAPDGKAYAIWVTEAG